MRLIDADALPKYTGYALSANEVAMAVETAPTIEAVPVIRCMDCAYGTKCKSPQHRLCERSGDLLLWNDYCSRPERREE